MLFPLRNPAVVLAALLQVLPLARTLVTNPATASTFAIVLRWTLGTTAALGAFDSVSGATSVFTTPSTINGSVGNYLSNNVTVSIGGGNTAASQDYFIVTAGTASSPALANNQSTTVGLPPGLTFKSSWVNNSSTIGGVIYGTPTTAGTYPFSVTCVSPGNAQLSQAITVNISGSVGPTAPAIASPPVAANVIAGNTATFTVTASGTAPLAYFWLKNGNPLANAGNISGANTATLTVASVSAADAANYSVLVSNSVSTVTSAAVALTVVVPPALTSQPAPQTVTVGFTTSFSVTATGSAPLTYQWLKNNVAIANGAKYSGVSSSVLTVATVAAADAGNYSVVVTNLAGSVTSSTAALTVVSAPTITTPPANLSIIAGANASFTVAAAGSAPLYYFWLKNGSVISDGGNVSGAATATLNLSTVTTGDVASYSVIVSNSLGTATSTAATLTVAVPPVVVTSPVGATLIAGSNITFTVTASGTAPLTYQWLKNGGTISGANSPALTIANLSATDAANYSVTVTNAVGSATSASATLTVLVPPALSTQPTSATVAQGGNTSFSVSATGTAPLSFQWLKNGLVIPNAAAGSLSLTGVTTNDAGNYSVVVTNIAGAVTSSSATLTVVVVIAPTIVSQPANATVTAGNNVSFTVAVNASASVNYQWRKNGGNLANGGNISGATSATLTLANVSAADAASYSVAASNSDGTATSSTATLTVLFPPSIVTQPASQSGALGSTISLSVNVSGTGPLSYQWFGSNGALTDGGNLSGSATSTLTIPALTTNELGNYFVVVSNALGSVTSTSASVSILGNSAPTITMQPANQNGAAGSNVVFNVTATGSGTLIYQWRKNGKNLVDGKTVSGTKTNSLTLSALTTKNNGVYSVVIKNSLGSVTSADAALTVFIAPVLTLQAASREANAGTDTSFRATVTGTTPINYQWFKDGNPLTDGGNISGSISNVLTVANVTTNDSGIYSLTASNFAGAVTSSGAGLAVILPPAIIEPPEDQFIVISNRATFTVKAVGGGLHYQWHKGNKLIAGATNAIYSIASVKTTDATSYSVVIANHAGTIASPDAKLIVILPPVFTQQPVDQSVNRGATATFAATVKGTAPFSYQWFRNGARLVDGKNTFGSTSNVLTIINVSSRSVGSYSLSVSNFAALIISSNAVLSLKNSDNLVANTANSATSISPAAAPVITQIVRNADGSITLTGSGTAGTNYTLQGTADLSQWINLQTNVADTNGMIQLTDTNATTLPARFYRLATP